MHLKALVTSLLLASSVASAQVKADVKANVTIQVKPPSVIIRDRDRPPPRGYVRFDDYKDYDRDDKVRMRFDITGTYDSQYGRLTLTQEGTRVYGTYLTTDNITGHLKGRIRNGNLNYRWKQEGSEGQGTWYVNTNGRNKRIKGTWGTFESRNNAGAWDLTRVDGPPPPPPPSATPPPPPPRPTPPPPVRPTPPPPPPPPAPEVRDHRH